MLDSGLGIYSQILTRSQHKLNAKRYPPPHLLHLRNFSHSPRSSPTILHTTSLAITTQPALTIPSIASINSFSSHPSSPRDPTCPPPNPSLPPLRAPFPFPQTRANLKLTPFYFLDGGAISLCAHINAPSPSSSPHFFSGSTLCSPRLAARGGGKREACFFHQKIPTSRMVFA